MSIERNTDHFGYPLIVIAKGSCVSFDFLALIPEKMKNQSRQFSYTALVLTTAWLSSTVCAQQIPVQPTLSQVAPVPNVAPTISIVTDHVDALYRTSENATFSIEVKRNGVAVPAGEIAYQFSVDGVGDLGKGMLALQNGIAKVSSTLKKPGVLRCSVTFMGDGVPLTVMAGAAFNPFKIKPTTIVPSDFNKFWNTQKAELAAIAPDPQLKLITQPNDKVEAYEISLANINGSRVYGFFARPKADGPHPAILQVPGAGANPVQPGYVIVQAAKGFIAMDISVHDITNNRAPETGQPLMTGELLGYPTRGREDRLTYYFRRVFLGCVRSVDYLTGRSEWDKKHMIIHGSSQGGALSLVTAGLDSRITALAANVPALCDHTGRAFGRPSGWPQLIPTDANGKLNPRIAQVSRYYDAVNFARRIRVPVIMGIGLIDTTCPATTDFSAYNVLKGPKQIDIAPLMGHSFSKTYVERSEQFILERAGLKTK